ncbi:MAG: hypothetical protein ABA06_00240 [Parcubacteria bacterium C7867-001]|nr:MAG: hypothetical protein ABA06_00240 [Parcubacteria bacterium C7867-001]
MRMETMNTSQGTRRAMVNGLAVVGFVALIFAGMTLAIYSARYIPQAVTRLATASVYFSSVFSPASTNELTVVPSKDDEGSSVVATSTDTTPTTPSTGGTPAAVTPSAGPRTTGTYVVGGGTAVPQQGTLYGLSDLSVNIVAVGYLANQTDTTSFVASKTVPDGKRGAVRFTVTNVGTNTTGGWDFDATLPTSPSYTFSSPTQAALLPGEHIDFTLGFDRGRTGTRTIDISIDPDKKIVETSENNNSGSIAIEIL